MKTKKNVMIMLIFILSFNAFSLTRDFVSQMDSEIDPKVICFPSAMINSAIYLGLDLPVKESKYTNIVDIYDEYLHSKEIRFWIRNYAPAYVRVMAYSDKYDNDIREIWQIEESAFNSFMGQKTCKLRINKRFDYLEEIIKDGGVAVISGMFSGRKHCVSLIEINDNTVTFIDSFGSPYDNYKNKSSYQIVKMNINEFKKRVKQEDTGKYTFIEFRKDFPQSLVNVKQNIVDSSTYLPDNLYNIDGISESSNLINYKRYCETANDLGYQYILSYDSFVDSVNLISDMFNISHLEAINGPILKNSFTNVSLEYLVVLYGLSIEKGLDISDTHKIESSFYSAEGNIENALRIYVDGYERYLFLQDSDESNEVVKYYRNLCLDNFKDENVYYIESKSIFSTSIYKGLIEKFTNVDSKNAFSNVEYSDILFNRVICTPIKKRLEEERVSDIGKKYYVNEYGNFIINF